MPKVKDLTNATCHGNSGGNVDYCQYYANDVNAIGATPSSSENNYMRYIGTGFFSEWGDMLGYTGANFHSAWLDAPYWTSDQSSDNRVYFEVDSSFGYVLYSYNKSFGVCVYP